MRVPFVNLGAQFNELESQLVDAFTRIGRQGQYILDYEVARFESGLAEICQTKYVVSIANGTDGLQLMCAAFGIGAGDEVIIPVNTFIATAGGVALMGAKPVYVDVGSDYNVDVEAIEPLINSRTKAIVPVHLTGNPADMDAINQIAQKHNLKVMEDAAQAIGASYRGRRVGSLCDAGVFSLHPLKNLHLMGDAGFISTNDKQLYNKLRKLRNHGLKNRNESEFWGFNSRLDNMQAAFGNVKLPYFEGWTERFKEIAKTYTEELHCCVSVPKVRKDDEPVFHNYVIQVEQRDKLIEYLGERGVDAKIHYPIPLHLMECSKHLGYKLGDFPHAEKQAKHILSLPIYPELTDEQVHYVCQLVQEFSCIESQNCCRL